MRDEHIDWNVLNFERLKWGGVRHGEPSYMAFDLLILLLVSARIVTLDVMVPQI